MKKLVLIFTLMASYSAWAQGDIDAGKLKAATCVACHGSDGNAIIGQYPKLAGQHADYLVKQLADYKLAVTSSGAHAQYIQLQLQAFRSSARNNDLNAMMRSAAVKLNDNEIEALSAYVGGLH
jgi:cytochrome c553